MMQRTEMQSSLEDPTDTCSSQTTQVIDLQLMASPDFYRTAKQQKLQSAVAQWYKLPLRKPALQEICMVAHCAIMPL